MEPSEDGSDDDLTPPSPRVLDDKEETLLSLFNQLPEAEKLRLIIHTKDVLQEMDILKNSVYDIINNINK